MRYKIIITTVEGEFLLLKTFKDTETALHYCDFYGFETYEITNNCGVGWKAFEPDWKQKTNTFQFAKRIKK